MKKHLTSLLFFFLVFAVNAKQIEVCISCKTSKLQDAISIANTHDTIFILQGVYYEYDVVIDKPITIIGNGAIIDAKFKGGILNILADSIYISGLILNNIKTSYVEDIAAIMTFNTNHFIFENLEINKPFFAMLIQKSKNGIIRNNVIYGHAKTEAGSGNGVHLWHSKNVLIKENKVFNMRDGIYLEFVENCTTTKNFSKGNLRYGLHFMFSNDNIYNYNIFDDNGAGVAVMFSKNITMKHNIFRYNWGNSSYGLLLKEIYDAEISDNTFIQNTIGINAEGSTRVNYFNNIFKRNGWATKIAGGCYDNIFYNNDFLNNTFDISYQGRKNGNTFNGNYWSDYTGYDLNKDGVGDVPYRPVKLFSYIINRTPETIILHRSLFVDIVNFSEKVSPIFTPKDLQDFEPVLKRINQ